MRELTKAERIMIAVLLKECADEYAQHSCNDLDLSKYLPDKSDWLTLKQAVETFYGADICDVSDDPVTSDSGLMRYLVSLFDPGSSNE